MTGKPTLAQVQALYKATQQASQRFAAYNFRKYFVQHTDETFAPAFALLGDKTSTPPEAIKAAAVAAQAARKGYGAPHHLPDFVNDDGVLKEDKLESWWKLAQNEFGPIDRQGTLSEMYKGTQRLVVEDEL